MKLWSRRLIMSVTGVAAISVIGVSWFGRAAAQTPAPAAKQPTAGEFFKNVTTSTLKGLSTDDFIGAMGVISAALGYDCADCHPGAGSDKVDWVIDTPKKKTTRKMVEMVAAINKTNFAGAQMVTCFTCHHGRDLPTTTIALDTLYGPPNDEHRDIVVAAPGAPPATEILDKYIKAVGGAQKLAGLTSFIATGTSVGYEGLGGGGSFQIIAKAPNQRATLITFKDHPERGDSSRTFDGTVGWVKTPRALLKDYQLVGSELDGARLDALIAFPGQIKTDLNNWRVGQPDTIGDKEVEVLQGSGPRGFIATFYFDKKTNYLVRVVRYSTSPVGRVPTQMDFDDYRDVGGIKFPFKYKFSWLDGRDEFQLSDVKVNVPVDAAVFGRPK